MPSTTDTYEWEIVDAGDNGEFLTWATLVYKTNGVETERETFTASSEDYGPSHSAQEIAASAGNAWHETMTTTLEARLGPFGIEWEREQTERGI